jgi:hypothetical protein
LAIIVAVKLQLSAHKGNPAATEALSNELERMRSNLPASNPTEQKLYAFDQTADALLDVLCS